MVLSVFYGTVRHSFRRQLSLLKKLLPLNSLSLPPRLRHGSCPYLQTLEAEPVSLHPAAAWEPTDSVTAPQQRGAGTNSWSSSNLLNHHSCFPSKHPTVPSEPARRTRRWKGRGFRSREMLWEPSHSPALPQLKANRCAVTAAALQARPLVSQPPPSPHSFFPASARSTIAYWKRGWTFLAAFICRSPGTRLIWHDSQLFS